MNGLELVYNLVHHRNELCQNIFTAILELSLLLLIERILISFKRMVIGQSKHKFNILATVYHVERKDRCASDGKENHYPYSKV